MSTSFGPIFRILVIQLLSLWKYSHFSIHMLTPPSPTIDHIRFIDNWLFVSSFFLVLFFIKWLYNDFLNFSFCKYISSHPTRFKWALLFTLSIYLNKFFLVEIPGTKQLTYLLIVAFNFKTCLCVWYKNRDCFNQSKPRKFSLLAIHNDQHFLKLYATF